MYVNLEDEECFVVWVGILESSRLYLAGRLSMAES